MRISALIAVLCLSFGAVLSYGQTPPAAAGYHLAFSDDFSHFDLSPDRGGAHTWYEGVWFNTHRAPMSNIKSTPDGLILTWTRGQDSANTSISTFSQTGKTDHSWKYGYFETRMRWTPTTGAWPAIWFIPDLTGDQVETGEFDLFEGNGDRPHTFFGTIHDWHQSHSGKMVDIKNSAQSNRFDLPEDTNFSEFHTYGVLWLPDSITWYFDDKPIHTEKSYPIFSAQTYCIIISMQEGVRWREGDLDGVQANQLDMNVKWIKVWQK
jgi:beta-glucanase (GH16 family)